ncbi:MAG TPA: nickel-type superoxide dismutase maturation protease [Acidimicrobiales bacterium]|nr:nickel-type superoxide dismutase maturation protease [Acidimicrobiales bacterium]
MKRADAVSLLVVGVGALVALASGRSLKRIEVSGPSMIPTLSHGDRLIVVRPPGVVRPGDLVALRDPEDDRRLLVKRVTSRRREGLVVHGDNPGASRDSRDFGTVPHDAVIGRALYRYHPPARAGLLRRDVATLPLR